MIASPDPACRTSRLPALDGLRGMAILMVVLFHAYARWSEVEPFAQPRWTAPAGLGWMGVQLFFAISGYVIAMSLTRGRGWQDFARRRWLRLFPAMLMASLLIVATAPLLPDRPGGPIAAQDILPGLMFIRPDLLSALLPVEAASLDGAFWSIYVEAAFYAAAALAFFGIGDRRLRLVGVLYAAFLGCHAIDRIWGVPGLPEAFHLVGIPHWGWFFLGITAWESARTGRATPLAAGLVAAALSTVDLMGRGPAPLIAITGTGLAFLFLIAVRAPNRVPILAHPAFVWLGWVSYPLYLVHQNITTGLAIRLGHAFPGLPAPLYPLPGIALCLLAAAIIARAEPGVRAIISRPHPRLKARDPAR